MDWLKAILEEAPGEPSTMRLMVAIVVIIQMVGWAYVVFRTGTLPPIDWQQIGLVVGPLMAKAWQKGKEQQ